MIVSLSSFSSIFFNFLIHIIYFELKLTDIISGFTINNTDGRSILNSYKEYTSNLSSLSLSLSLWEQSKRLLVSDLSCKGSREQVVGNGGGRDSKPTSIKTLFNLSIQMGIFNHHLILCPSKSHKEKNKTPTIVPCHVSPAFFLFFHHLCNLDTNGRANKF